MRSIIRGNRPTASNGQPVSFTNYRQAKSPLVSRIGDYCCYCERTGDLHVEHVIPKSHCSHLEREWTNLLLGCSNCNGRKSAKNKSREGYIWPDTDDTFSAFVYQSGGRVAVKEGLPTRKEREARALFDLVKLGEVEEKDRRRGKRREAWNTADMARKDMDGENSRRLIVQLALATGFFSVWMAVFHDNQDMRQRFIEAFPGTRTN